MVVAEPGVVAVVRHPRLAAVEALIEQAIAERVFPGAVLAVVGPDGLLHLAAYGQISYGPDAPPAAVDTLYDLASLTKVVGTTTAVMRLVERGLLDLDRPVGADWPAFAVGERARIRLVHLLTHSAGLPPVFPGHFPVYFRGRTPSREEIYEEVVRLPLEYPPGTRTVYSDLGFLVLGRLLEALVGPLDIWFWREIFAPLGMVQTGFNPPRAWRARCAPTELCPWRGRLLIGEVHDECAFAMGGVAPHAGLFSVAADLARFARLFLNDGRLDGQPWLHPETIRLFTTRAGLVPGSSRALGWDTPSPTNAAGQRMSPRAFGHTGFTGTSLWVDPERGLAVILLSNRVHPCRQNTRIIAFRPRLHDAVFAALA